MRPVALLALAVPLAMLAAPALAADGAATFNSQCKSCHSLAPASGPTGPSLKGVVGRKVAGAAGYAYSPGLKAKGGAWSEAALDAYLTAPAKYAPGTKMFTKVPDPVARKAVIAFLKTQK